MAVNKVLEIDLNNLTTQSLQQIDKGVDRILGEFENRDTRDIKDKFADPLTIPKSQKEEGLRKIFGRQTFGNLIRFGSNPFGFIQGTVTKLIPFIGTALIVTGVIAALVKRVDDFQKAFTDNVDDRIDKFRSKEQQVNIQAGLTQLIITGTAGSAEPRDAYNTFQVFNTDQSRIEADFKLRDNSGVD